jgi:hypothetical protein
MQKGLKGNQIAKEKAAGEFLLAFAQFSQAEGIHAEMSLKKAASDFEKKYRRTETINR